MQIGEKITYALFALVIVCAVYTSISLYQLKHQVITVPCEHHESPLVCQKRLGDSFEVIYNATTREAWGELVRY